MVKCSDCGFLGVWYPVRKQWLHADQRYRRDGLAEGVQSVMANLYPARCFALAFDLEQERVGWENAGKDFMGATSTVLDWGRECPEWVKWRNGFTPKEHAEMLDRQRLLAWQARREDADREWRERQRREESEWRDRQEERAARASRWDRRSRLTELMLAAIGIGVASFFVIKAANIQANAQLRATQMQIEALKAVAPPPSLPINE